MTEQSIITWIIGNKFAKNEFQATAIANGLHLAEIAGEPELQQRRVRLYRAWRDSKVFNTTAECFLRAMEGEEVPELFKPVGQAESEMK